MASSSASFVTKTFKYDVFLSFRGETRLNFVDHLNFALQQRNIHTYKDDEKMKKGKMINEDLIESIKDSKFHIIVFSKDYPSSSWCLDELVTIMECHKEIGHTTYPVFYDVKPSEVRNQNGAFGKAFAKLKKEMGTDSVQKGVFGNAFSKLRKEKAIKSDQKGDLEKWGEALKEAANLAGWELKKTADGHEAMFIQKIVEMVSLELRSTHFSIDEKLVGMNSRIEDVLSSLATGCDDVRMIGIRGMGGIGKTTLARAVFDRISLQFQGKSFVENVREVSSSMAGLMSLQNQVLSDVLNDQGMRVSSVLDGKNMLKRMMGGRKVLLVLDDVDSMDQLDALAGEPNWFKPGSIIIITTRDEQVLVAHKVKLIRNVDLLSDIEAICLFSRYAFGREIPIQEYEEFSRKVVVYAAGLPLTIKVLGSFLCGKSKLEWIDALKRLKNIPLEETLKKLELSYSGLEKEYKEIFLDVACILKGNTTALTILKLESCGFHARIGLRVLEQKSLITFYDRSGIECVGMHDHIEEMGRNIVRRLHPDKPNKHTRLWINEEIEDIFINDLGTKATKCMVYLPHIMPHYNSRLNIRIVMQGLRKMKELRFLHISWNGAFVEHDAFAEHDDRCLYFPSALRCMQFDRYPFVFLPKTYGANNLVTLSMPDSNIVELWEGGDGKVLNKLKSLDLSSSKLRIFNLGLTPNLEALSLNRCHDLEKLHMPVTCPSLRYLTLSQSKIRTFHFGLAPNLELIVFGRDGELVELYMPVECPKLRYIALFGSTLGALDLGPTPNLEMLFVIGHGESVEVRMPVEYLKLTCIDLVCSTLGALDLSRTPNLDTLKLDIHDGLKELYMPIECLKLRSLKLYGLKLRTLDLGLTPNVEELDLSGDLKELHMPVECLKLKSFKFHGFKLITFDIGLTPNLEELDLNGDLVEIYITVESPKLRFLKLNGSKFRTLDLGLTPNLEELYLRRCYDLVELHVPNGCLKLKYLSFTKSNIRTLDFRLTPNLERLDIDRCYKLVQLYLPNGCLKLKYIDFRCLELRTINLFLCLNLQELNIYNCFNLVKLRLPDGCLKLEHLECINLNFSTLDLMLAPILKSLTLRRCNNLVEFHMPRPSPKLEWLLLSEVKLRTLDIGPVPNLKNLILLANSKLRTLKLGPTPNLEKLVLKECYDLEELCIARDCQKLVSVKINHSKLRTLDLGLTPNLRTLQLIKCSNLEKVHLGLAPNLEDLVLWECNNLEELQMSSSFPNLRVLFAPNSQLRTLDLGATPSLKKLDLGNCFDLEEFQMADECQNLTYLEISHSKLRTLNLGFAPNLEMLYLCESNELVEFYMPGRCLNLRDLFLTNSKLRKLDLGLTPNLKELELGICCYLEEFHMVGECPKLESLEINFSNLRTLDLSLTPNIKKLDLKGCYKLVELHVPIGGLEKLVYLDLSGCLRFRSFLFEIKDDTDESFQFGPLAELSFILKKCPLHPENNLPKFQFTCLYIEDLPSLTRNLEKLISGRSCACKDLERFSISIFRLRN